MSDVTKSGSSKSGVAGIVSVVSVVATAVAVTLALAGGAWGLRDRLTKVEVQLTFMQNQLSRIEVKLDKHDDADRVKQ